jgi:hypothetical protein
MEKGTRKSIRDDLKTYCHLSKNHDYIELTEWSNGEGFDVDINSREKFSLTRGEFDAIRKLKKALYK